MRLPPSLAAFAFLFLSLGAQAEEPPWHHHAHPSMGTVLEVDYQPRRGESERSLERAIIEVGRVEAVVSHWDANSELSRFNALADGVPHAPSKSFSRLFAASEHYRDATGGAFSCHLEPYLSWKKFMPPAPGSTPSGESLFDRCAPHSVVLSSGKLLKMYPGAGLDFDGLAKGHALDGAARLLRRGARAFVLSYGSSGIVFGPGAGRALALPDPRSGGPGSPYLAAVWIESGAWSTSSCAENLLEGRCHILDPRTLEPVATPLLSATVFAPSAETADALSTAVMVLGADEGMRLLGKMGLGGVLILSEPAAGALPVRGLYLLATPDMADRMEVTP